MGIVRSGINDMRSFAPVRQPVETFAVCKGYSRGSKVCKTNSKAVVLGDGYCIDCWDYRSMGQATKRINNRTRDARRKQNAENTSNG